MEKVFGFVVLVVSCFLSCASFAQIEETTTYGTPINYEPLSFGDWNYMVNGISAGAASQTAGSEYSNYRADLAKKKYCAQLKADRDTCRLDVLSINAGAVSQCTTAKSYTTTGQIGADGKIINGNVAVTYTFDNKDDCYRVTDAYKDAALASCDAIFSNKKVQSGFCY
ncbi:hypothetical protein [Cellvibrio sp. OA-2007]|uniref:hypothetical protein n=1 Tax=Cellvibrio sp. OA-2007 TaxID=529823 RepID=UPI0007805974|nr:hypothetical protein [Cellvibrio sp. OA-2007]